MSEVDQWLGIEEDKERERVMSESEQVSQESELHKEYDALYGHADPTDESPSYWYWLETKVAALEAKLSKMKEQLRDIPGVNLQAKISVLRLWAEPEMERRAEEKA